MIYFFCIFCDTLYISVSVRESDAGLLDKLFLKGNKQATTNESISTFPIDWEKFVTSLIKLNVRYFFQSCAQECFNSTHYEIPDILVRKIRRESCRGKVL